MGTYDFTLFSFAGFHWNREDVKEYVCHSRKRLIANKRTPVSALNLQAFLYRKAKTFLI